MKKDLFETLKKAPYFAGYLVSTSPVSRLIQRNQEKDEWLFEDKLIAPRAENLATHAFILHAAKGCVYESHFKDRGIVKKDLDQWLIENNGKFVVVYEHDFNQVYIDKCVEQRIPYASLNILQMVRENNLAWLNGALGSKDHEGQICSEFVANASKDDNFVKEFNLQPWQIKPSMVQLYFYRQWADRLAHVPEVKRSPLVYAALTL